MLKLIHDVWSDVNYENNLVKTLGAGLLAFCLVVLVCVMAGRM